MKQAAWKVAIALSCAMFAGCLGGDDADSTPSATTAPDAVVSETKGSVSGQVLTTALVEVAGATIALVQGPDIVQDTTTDAAGRYTFNEVDPGEYRIQVNAACCKSTIRTVHVEANKLATVAFALEPFTAADLQAPYVEPWEWHGFISCGLGTPIYKIAVCSIANDPNEDFLKTFNVSKGLKSFVYGMTWEPVGGVSGEEFLLTLEESPCMGNACGNSYDFATITSAPPIINAINNDDIEDEDFKWDNITETFDMHFRVFTGSDAGIVYQQPFSIYVEEFYYEEAPEGHNPIPDQ